MESRLSFGKEDRLRKRRDFLALAAAGRKLHTKHFIIVWSHETTGRTRLGITVSRKVGKAFVRNRIKRLVREYFRLHKEMFQRADYNIIAKKGADKLLFHDVCLELDKAVQLSLPNRKC